MWNWAWYTLRQWHVTGVNVSLADKVHLETLYRLYWMMSTEEENHKQWSLSLCHMANLQTILNRYDAFWRHSLRTLSSQIKSKSLGNIVNIVWCIAPLVPPRFRDTHESRQTLYIYIYIHNITSLLPPHDANHTENWPLQRLSKLARQYHLIFSTKKPWQQQKKIAATHMLPFERDQTRHGGVKRFWHATETPCICTTVGVKAGEAPPGQ
jgi:hypothetical protein